MNISATILADSYNEDYKGSSRITTLLLKYPRFIHTHLLTHRAFSRNTASSRAIPISKYIEVIENNCAYPVEFRKNVKGMQSGELLDEAELQLAKEIWLNASKNAINTAKEFIKLGVSKEVSNRVLEPFMWIECILTGTDFDNFFEQRISKLAQPEMFQLATQMKNAIEDSKPNPLTLSPTSYKTWHLPYKILNNAVVSGDSDIYEPLVCAGQVARVSYTKFNNEVERSDDESNYKLAVNTLIPNKHWSPFEHIATPGRVGVYYDNYNGFMSLRSYLKKLGH